MKPYHTLQKFSTTILMIFWSIVTGVKMFVSFQMAIATLTEATDKHDTFSSFGKYSGQYYSTLGKTPLWKKHLKIKSITSKTTATNMNSAIKVLKVFCIQK